MRRPSSLAIALALLTSGCAGVTVVPGTYPGDTAIWRSLVAKPEALRLEARPVAAIAPHHLIDGFELGAFWKALGDQGPTPVIAVLGPDHRGRGGGEVTVGEHLRFTTAFGDLEPDAALVAGLRRLAPVGTRDAAFRDEHSIHVHAPFIRRFLPQARVLPVIVRWGTAPATLEALAKALDALLPPDALLVASVDFSHFQPADWASFHDEASWATLAGLEPAALFNREADSPESLFVAMRFAMLREARRVTRVLHTNSQSKRAVFVPDSTSHQYVTFARGEPAPSPSVSVLVTGEVAASTGLTLRGAWRWRSWEPADVPDEPRLQALRGEEDRFLMGADAYLFRLEPGQRNEARIHGLRVAFAAVGLGEVSDAAATVKDLRGSADCLFLLAVRGGEPAEAAEQRALALSDAGAQVVVGRGFGAPRPLEYRGDRLVALSLGDFLPEELKDSRGTALGVTWTPTGIRARTMPLILNAGAPRLDVAALAESMGVARE